MVEMLSPDSPAHKAGVLHYPRHVASHDFWRRKKASIFAQGVDLAVESDPIRGGLDDPEPSPATSWKRCRASPPAGARRSPSRPTTR